MKSPFEKKKKLFILDVSFIAAPSLTEFNRTHPKIICRLVGSCEFRIFKKYLDTTAAKY